MKARERKNRGRLSRLGLCVCQTKNPMQRWVQLLVLNKIQNKHLENIINQRVSQSLIDI